MIKHSKELFSKKKSITFLAYLVVCFFCCLPLACTNTQSDDQENGQPVLSPNKVFVVATLYPQYDFARIIAGDKASVSLLLPPGVESHDYEPTPADIKRVREADVFVYTSDQMEPWAASLAKSSGSRSVVVDASVCDTALKSDDPHIWTDPLLAKIMVDNITEGLCEADPMNADFFRERAEEYKILLDQLDDEMINIVAAGTRRTLALGGRNAFANMARRYGLTIYAAYDSCAEEIEPSPQNIAMIIEKVKSEDLPVIYYEELVDAKVARTISEATGKQMLMLHSCHNVSKEELEVVSFLGLMRQNADNIAKGLK
ncbi:MAG: metal ABC transporter substrate-binding protein [Peptococcaceae bacterium]|nr:metal ABC transporter substrate-binding protein [Peptococcaceae bacterium]